MDKHDLTAILGSSNRDFLVRNNGDQVKVGSLKGKIVGLYFSASWCGPCQRFTPKLAEVYNELHPVAEFEIVYISDDDNDESFSDYFSKMPWLAIPFSDSETRAQLDQLFSVKRMPHLVILNKNGEVSTTDGVEIVTEYGSEGYPFVHERLASLKEREEEARKNQSLKTLLVSPSRDHVLTAEGNKVSIAELEGKTVGLYFCLATFRECILFTSKLVEVYKSLKEDNENFEIVMIPLGNDEQWFKSEFEHMPWLSLPVEDKLCEKLIRYFELSTLPTVVIIGPDGKTLHANAAEAIEEHGTRAYPFTPDKFIELEEVERAKKEAQTLESLLVSKDCDFVIGQDGAKVHVNDLVGKTILLYFSAHWCPPCRAFLPKLVDSYQTIKAENKAVEVIFISSDRDQPSFDEFFSKMPWLALPFDDERKEALSRLFKVRGIPSLIEIGPTGNTLTTEARDLISKMPWLALPFDDERNEVMSRLFKVRGIPSLIAIGPTGKTLTTDARDLISAHGANAYPFTAQRVKEIEEEFEKMAEGWPKKVNYAEHEHELGLTKRASSFNCDGCGEGGQIWSYYCEECDYDLHPKCALGDGKQGTVKEGGNVMEISVLERREKRSEGRGWICDG